jgi:hypothetical protein
MRHCFVRAAATLGLLSQSLLAQDLIGVTFAGAVLRLDGATGAVTTLANGQAGKNCLAFDNQNRLWTTVRSGSSPAFQYHLARIDPFTGAETLPFGNANVGDLRAMCQRALDGSLLAVREATPSDELVRIDTTTGAVTVIGPTGFTGIQGLDATSAGLRAWDVNAGVLLVNVNSGTCTDPFPSVGGPGGALQFLASDTANDRKYVGRDALFELNTVTGTTTPVVQFAGAPDLRGVEFLSSRAQPFGQPCAGTGGDVFLALNTPFGAGGTATFVSTHHAPGAIGIQILGLDDSSYAGLPLPLDLDPLLGTDDCSLLVSADFTQIGLAQPNGLLAIAVAIPASAAFTQFFVQHAALEPVPGGFSFSWALRVRSGMFP